MKLRWVEDDYPGIRTDLDLKDDHFVRIGYFRDYKNKPLTWVPTGAFMLEEDFSHLTLDEAKAVVEAMIRLEG